MTYAVKIGGSPGSPGSEEKGRRGLRLVEALNQVGRFPLNLAAASGTPAADDYFEVTFNGETVYTGFLREARRRRDDESWWLSGHDALGEVLRKEINARVSYSSTNERAVVTDILNRVGITTSSSPLRFTSSSILGGGSGQSVSSHLVHYDKALSAIALLADGFGREFWVEKDGSNLVFHYEAQKGTTGTPQDTWTLGEEITNLEDIGDSWDKAGQVRVVGNGDGEGAVTGTAGSSGDLRVFNYRAITSSTFANSLAGQIQSALNADRQVLVAYLGLENITASTGNGGRGLQTGDLVRLLEEDGSTLIGDFRIYSVEHNEEGAVEDDGTMWLTRATLISPSVPVVRALTQEGGVRPPVEDVENFAEQHQRYAQLSDEQTVAAGANQVYSASGSQTVTGGSGHVLSDVTSGGETDPAKLSGFLAQYRLTADGNGQKWGIEVEFRDQNNVWQMWNIDHVSDIDNTVQKEIYSYIPSEFLLGNGITDVTGYRVRFVNLDSVDQDGSFLIILYEVPRHTHNR